MIRHLLAALLTRHLRVIPPGEIRRVAENSRLDGLRPAPVDWVSSRTDDEPMDRRPQWHRNAAQWCGGGYQEAIGGYGPAQWNSQGDLLGGVGRRQMLSRFGSLK